MTCVDEESREKRALDSKRPKTRDDWRTERTVVDTVLDDVQVVVTRVGDEIVEQMCSLFDGQGAPN